MEERDNKVFARNVRAFRVLRGWSMRDLSKRTGLSLQTIVNVESGRGCNPITEERFANGFGTFIGRLWDGALFSEERQRVIPSHGGRWFFTSHEAAREFAKRQRLLEDDTDNRFRMDPEPIQDQLERHRLGRVWGWCFGKALGGGVGDSYYRYGICEVFGRDLTPRKEIDLHMLIQATYGNIRIGIRENEYEIVEGDSFVFEHSDPWWVEPMHQIRHGERPAIIHIITLGVLSLGKRSSRSPKQSGFPPQHASPAAE